MKGNLQQSTLRAAEELVLHYGETKGFVKLLLNGLCYTGPAARSLTT